MGELGRQTHFCAIHSPKSANPLYNISFTHVPGARAALDFAHPAHPIATPCRRGVVVSGVRQ